MRYIWWLFVAALAIAATVVLQVDRSDKSPSGDRTIPGPWPTVAIYALAGVAGATATKGLFGELRAEDKASFRREMDKILSGTLATLYTADAAGDVKLKTQWYRVGLHVWLIPRWYRFLTPRHRIRQFVPGVVRRQLRRPRLTPQLKRLGKVRLVDPQKEPSGVQWRRGMGVLGRVWDTREPYFFNSEKQWAPFRDFTETQWDASEHEDKLNLTYREFSRLEPRFGQVLVVPIRKKRNDDDEHPEVIGCVAFDTPKGCHEEGDIIEDHVTPTLYEAAEKAAQKVKS